MTLNINMDMTLGQFGDIPTRIKRPGIVGKPRRCSHASEIVSTMGNGISENKKTSR